MSDRVELRQMYVRAWDTWDANLLKASLAEDFFFDDPTVPERIAVDTIADYMSRWHERVKAMGGTGEITSQDRVEADVSGALISWYWWDSAGTEFESSAIMRTTDDGVRYERITYYPTRPKFSK